MIDPTNLKVGVKRTKKISKGSLLIEVNSKEVLQLIENEVAVNNALKDNYIFKKADKMKPKVIVFGVEEVEDNEQITEGMKQQNDSLNEAEINKEFTMKTKRELISSLDSESFTKIIKHCKVNIG